MFGMTIGPAGTFQAPTNTHPGMRDYPPDGNVYSEKSVYAARRNNAHRMAKKLNALLDKGYLILDGYATVYRFYIEPGTGDVYYTTSKDCRSQSMIFINNMDEDDGLHTTISQFNKELRETFIVMKQIKNGF